MKITSFLPLKLFVGILSFVSFIPAYSATIEGRIKDAKTGEGLIGATVYLKENNQVNAVTGLDGSYAVKDVAPGTYTLVAQFFSYLTREVKITVLDASGEIIQDFSMQPDSLMLKEVQITGGYDKESDMYARNQEKNSDYELNIISSKTMLLLPDITVGDVLQRVSGIVTQKSVTGGGQFAVIRGMEKRYNYATINGVKIPSPDYQNDYVPMDLFPSQILGRLEVIKTLRPDMDGDAIGGVMNLVLKDPPDYLSINAEASGGYNQTLFNNSFNSFNSGAINPKSPEAINGPAYVATPSDFPTSPFTYNQVKPIPNGSAGFTFGDRFLNNKLGVILSALYENDYSQTKAFFLTPDPQTQTTEGPNTPIFDDVENRVYSTQQTRDAAHLRLEYNISPKHKISFYSVYVGMNQYRSDFKTDTSLGTGSGAGLASLNYETKVTLEHIYNATLQGQDSLAHDLNLDWTAAYSNGFSNTPDWGTLSTGNTVEYSPIIYYSGWTGRWWQNTDQDFAGYLNLTYKMTIFGQDVKFKVGAMNRDKDRVDEYEDYSLNPTSTTIPVSTPFTDDIWTLSGTGTETGSQQSANNYTVVEDVTAVYGMVNFNVGPRIEVMGGLRGENTQINFNTQLPITEAADYGNIHYIDYLPSGEIKFKITSKQSIRASYFSSLARPNFNELMPIDVPGDYYTTIGNPELLHTQAQNYDLRYEFFPSLTEELLAGVFYKNLVDPIEWTFLRYKASSQYLEPINDTNKAYCYGFELVVSKYIKNFGVSANYTYTKSSTTVPDEYYYYDAATNKQTNEFLNETRPLQGQANNTGNLSFIYDDSKIGLKIMITGVYTGKLIYATSPLYGLDLWQLPQERVDFSFEQKLSKKIKLSIFGKVNNILNTPLEIYEYPPSPYYNVGYANYIPNQTSGTLVSNILQEKETYGQTYWLGIRYRF
jgi:CarboxypepD_reg-like domain/TonB-dependent Receptor Plug Domain